MQPAGTGPALEARGLTRTYRQGAAAVEAVKDVDLTLEAGELLALTGPSGSGKSTLLHLLGGLERPDEGEAYVGAQALGELSDDELTLLRRRRIGFVLQFFNLMPTLSAIENVAFPLALDSAPDARDRARQMLARVGLAERAGHRPSELSGGEQQRLALARALVTSPAVVLADEPTGNLDSATGREILMLMREVADGGQAILMVTHSEEAAGVATRVARFKDGRKIGERGAGQEG